MCIKLYLQDLEKKEAEYKKSENIACSEYNTSCKQLGITDYSTFRHELMDKVKELPEIYQKIAQKTKNLDKVVEFYSAFVEFTFGQQYDGNCVPMIKYVIGMFKNYHIYPVRKMLTIVRLTTDFDRIYYRCANIIDI